MAPSFDRKRHSSNPELTRDERAQLRVRQVSLLYAQSLVGMSATLAAAVILLGVFWNVAPRSTLLTWFGTLVLVTTFRLGLHHRYRRSLDEPDRIGYWLTWFIVATAASGLTWGLTVILIAPHGSMVQMSFPVLWVSGLSAGAVAAYSATKTAFFAFSLPALIPGALYLLNQNNQIEITLGSALLLFCGFLSLNALRMHRTILNSLQLELENTQLITNLNTEKKRVERLNDRLERRVEERTAELSRANARLRREIAERTRAEAEQRDRNKVLERLAAGA